MPSAGREMVRGAGAPQSGQSTASMASLIERQAWNSPQAGQAYS
jgi:hypothetical protein